MDEIFDTPIDAPQRKFQSPSVSPGDVFSISPQTCRANRRTGSSNDPPETINQRRVNVIPPPCEVGREGGLASARRRIKEHDDRIIVSPPVCSRDSFALGNSSFEPGLSLSPCAVYNGEASDCELRNYWLTWRVVGEREGGWFRGTWRTWSVSCDKCIFRTGLLFFFFVQEFLWNFEILGTCVFSISRFSLILNSEDRVKSLGSFEYLCIW